MKRKPIPQFDLPFKDEPFRLVVDQTIDGDRVTKEQKDKENARREAEAKQSTIYELLRDEPV